MVYSDLSTFLINASKNSKFSVTLPSSGGYIELSNTSGKAFSLGLSSILAILKDIDKNLDEFLPHIEYEEKIWRDLGAQYYSDKIANAMSTVQTKPLFSSLSKIINWANNIEYKSDSNISLSKEALSRAIEKVTLVMKEYIPHETEKTSKQLIKEKRANVFAKMVLQYFNNYDGLKKLFPYIQPPNEYGNSSIQYDGKKLTSIFKRSKIELSPEELSSGGHVRSFPDSIIIKGIDGYIYISNQWTGNGESRLYIDDFITIINSLYPEFHCRYVDDSYCLLENLEIEEKSTFQINTEMKGSLNFNYRNILLKGVPGTGKSHLIDNIITNKDKLNLAKNDHNILRINIHSASSNADLMQGIGIATNNDQIIYKEKQGLILNHIKKAIASPMQPFVIVMEEIQENSLNELIGDLIYLIEDTKRTDLSSQVATAFENIEVFIEEYINNNPETYYVEIPYLVSTETRYKKMILPKNLYIFCTSNYRDDKKVIEDNLLRRFEVIEVYPTYKEKVGEYFESQDVSNFLKILNEKILLHFSNNSEIHPDRFMIGHAIWLKVVNKKDFYATLLKVVTEFKDIKELDYDSNLKSILLAINNYPFGITKDELTKKNYKELIDYLQSKCYNDLFETPSMEIGDSVPEVDKHE